MSVLQGSCAVRNIPEYCCRSLTGFLSALWDINPRCCCLSFTRFVSTLWHHPRLSLCRSDIMCVCTVRSKHIKNNKQTNKRNNNKTTSTTATTKNKTKTNTHADFNTTKHTHIFRVNHFLILSSPAVNAKYVPGNQQCWNTLQFRSCCAEVLHRRSLPTCFKLLYLHYQSSNLINRTSVYRQWMEHGMVLVYFEKISLDIAVPISQDLFLRCTTYPRPLLCLSHRICVCAVKRIPGH